MNNYERQHVDRIISEIHEKEKNDAKWPVEKQAYYLYLGLCDIYEYKVDYLYSDEITYEELVAKIHIYREGTSEKGEAICIDMNKAYVEALNMLGIETNLIYVDTKYPLSHADVCFKNEEGNWYFANLTDDIMRVKTGMKVRNFGVSQERLEDRYRNKDPEKNKLFHVYRMNEQNDGKEFTKIPDELIDKWSEEFGYTFKGLYTNDALEMIVNEAQNEELIEELFETNKKDELVQKKLEFVMNKIGIINVHRKKKIGDKEAVDYYTRIMEKILSKEEQEKYFTQLYGFIEEDGKRKSKNIMIIRKDDEDVFYIYNPENQAYEKIQKEELLKSNILYHNVKEQRIDHISGKIDKLDEIRKQKSSNEEER